MKALKIFILVCIIAGIGWIAYSCVSGLNHQKESQKKAYDAFKNAGKPAVTQDIGE